MGQYFESAGTVIMIGHWTLHTNKRKGFSLKTQGYLTQMNEFSLPLKFILTLKLKSSFEYDNICLIL